MKTSYSFKDIELLLELSLQAGRRSEPTASFLKKSSVLFSGSTRDFIADVTSKLDKGLSLGDILISLPGKEEKYMGKVLKSAESNGQAVQALEEILLSMKKTRHFYQTLLQGALYPLVVLLFANIFFIFYVFFTHVGDYMSTAEYVRHTYDQLGVHDLSSFNFLDVRLLTIILIFVAFFLTYLLLSLRKSRFINFLRPQWFWNNVPVIRKILYLEYMRLFFSRLKLYLQFRLPLQEALHAVLDTTGSYCIPEKTRKKMLSDAEKGKPLDKVLNKITLFEPAYLAFIEESSNMEELTEQLEIIAEHYENNMEIVSLKLGVWLEPILLLIIGIVVFLALQSALTPHIFALFDFPIIFR